MMRIQGLELVLGKIGHGHVCPRNTFSGVRLQHSRHDPQKGRFSGSVRPDESNLRASVKNKAKRGNDSALSKGLGHILQGQNHVSGAGGLGKFELDCFFLVIEFDSLDFLQRFQTALGLCRLGRLGPEAVDERLHMGDFLLLSLIGRLECFLLGFPLFQIQVIVSMIHRGSPLGEFNHTVHHMIHERPVMGNQKNRAGKLIQKILEPFDGRNIQMIGRLIQKENFRAGDKSPGQSHAHSPSPGQGRHTSIHLGFRKIETGKNFPRGRLLLKSAGRRKPRLKISITGKKTGHLRLRLIRAGHQLLNLLHLIFNLLKGLVTTHDFMNGRPVGNDFQVLGKITDPGSHRKNNLAGVRLHLSRNHFEEGRFSCPVGTDDSHPFFETDLERQVVKQGFGRIML